ncbi:MAG: dihydrofolate reductase family protein, partial [Buchnera aphidicola]|nr:dihydrofolate reductase family protein [Buchnera aphidicola]
MSIDGKIALKNGKSKWITSPYSRQDVQKFRAKSSAILSTSSTILTDNALLNVRMNEFNKKLLSCFPINIFKQPIRIIVDSQNRINTQHKIIHTPGQI